MQAPRLSASALTNNIPKKTPNPAITADVRTDGAIDHFIARDKFTRTDLLHLDQSCPICYQMT